MKSALFLGASSRASAQVVPTCKFTVNDTSRLLCKHLINGVFAVCCSLNKLRSARQVLRGKGMVLNANNIQLSVLIVRS